MSFQKSTLLLTGMLLLMASALPATAVTLTVENAGGGMNETLTVPITVDNPEGVSGAALTIVYDASALNVTVDSDFFDTFYNQFDPLATTDTPNPDGGEYGPSEFPVLDNLGNPTGEVIRIPAVVGSVNYYHPLIANEMPVGLLISAARCTPGPAGGPAALFSLDISLKEGAASGTYPIQIIPTTLNNTNAGYAAGGETIDLVIGSDPTQPVASSFTVLLDDVGYADHVTNGQVEFTDNADSDGDGLFDAQENEGCTDSDDADTDDDGIPDGVEDANQNGTVDNGETDPCDPDTDGDLIQDGTELGYVTGHADTDAGFFQPDLDNATTTDPLDADSDDDGSNDGVEDADQNGRVDEGETDPNVKDAEPEKAKTMPWIPLLLLD